MGAGGPDQNLENSAMSTIGRHVWGLVEEPDSFPLIGNRAQIFRCVNQLLCPADRVIGNTQLHDLQTTNQQYGEQLHEQQHNGQKYSDQQHHIQHQHNGQRHAQKRHNQQQSDYYSNATFSITTTSNTTDNAINQQFRDQQYNRKWKATTSTTKPKNCLEK